MYNFQKRKEKYNLDTKNLKWIEMAYEGEHHHEVYGKFVFDSGVFQKMIENFQDKGRAYVRFGKHGGFLGAGYIYDLRTKTRDGVQFLEGLVDWTPTGQAAIRHKEIENISAEFQMNGLNKKTGQRQGPTINGAALLIDPFFDNMTPVSQAEDFDEDELIAASESPEGLITFEFKNAFDETPDDNALDEVHDKPKEGLALSETKDKEYQGVNTMINLSESLKEVSGKLEGADKEIVNQAIQKIESIGTQPDGKTISLSEHNVLLSELSQTKIKLSQANTEKEKVQSELEALKVKDKEREVDVYLSEKIDVEHRAEPHQKETFRKLLLSEQADYGRELLENTPKGKYSGAASAGDVMPSDLSEDDGTKLVQLAEKFKLEGKSNEEAHNLAWAHYKGEQ